MFTVFRFSLFENFMARFRSFNLGGPYSLSMLVWDVKAVIIAGLLPLLMAWDFSKDDGYYYYLLVSDIVLKSPKDD